MSWNSSYRPCRIRKAVKLISIRVRNKRQKRWKCIVGVATRLVTLADSISILSATGLLTFFLMYPFPHRDQKETDSREKYLNKHKQRRLQFYLSMTQVKGNFASSQIRKCFAMSKYLKVAKPNSVDLSLSGESHLQQSQQCRWKPGAHDRFFNIVMTVASLMCSHLIFHSSTNTQYYECLHCHKHSSDCKTFRLEPHCVY